MQNGLSKIFIIISSLSLAALSLNSSMAKSSENNFDISNISWAQLPVNIQQYYQTSAKTNKLKLKSKDIVAIRTWDDMNGSNYLLQFQRIQPVTDMSYYTKKGEIAAHLYIDNKKDTKRLWQVYDHIPCDLDLIANFSGTSSVISDINNNDMAEVSLPYYLGCRGDVSYDGMKVIMYEDQQKYAMRGNSAICNSSTILPVDSTGHYGGDYKIDENLLEHSKLTTFEKSLFKTHLKSIWQDNQCSVYFNYDNV